MAYLLVRPSVSVFLPSVAGGMRAIQPRVVSYARTNNGTLLNASNV